MQDSSPLSFVHQSITPPVSTVVDQGRVTTLTGRVTAASPLHHHYVVLLPISTAAGFGQGSDWVGRRLRCDQANGENAARSARAPLKNGAAVGGSRLKIATDVAGILGSSESAMSQWRKCLTVVIFRSGLTPRCAGLDPALSGIRRRISSSRNRRSGPVELQRGRRRLVRQTRNTSGT